jgi:hypothetical protein
VENEGVVKAHRRLRLQRQPAHQHHPAKQEFFHKSPFEQPEQSQRDCHSGAEANQLRHKSFF